MQNHCRQITAVLRQLLPSLQSPEERERKVAILILTEVGVQAGREHLRCLSLLLQPPSHPSKTHARAHPEQGGYPDRPPRTPAFPLPALGGGPQLLGTCLPTRPSLAQSLQN